MAETESREHWGTRIGFILAAVGSAVGLGNVWRFPFQVSEQGGATFVIVYLAIVLLVGLPAMLVEFSIGRRSQRNPIDAFKKLGYGRWAPVGVLCVFTGFVILAFYSVVGGWTLRYTVGSVTGGYFDDPGAYFGQISEGMGALGFHAIFMVLTIGIVAFGIRKGIEICTKILVPAIIVLLIGMIAYAMTLEGAMEGLRYYLDPDFQAIRENWTDILPSAAGQAFFTLSLGMGAMITYSSYIAGDDSLVVDSVWIVGFNTGIALLAGMVIFPVLFAVGLDPAEPGPGALFVGFGEAIAQAPGSQLLGVFFFGTVFIAAISSAISILEVVVSFVIDHYEFDRKPATIGVGAIIFLVGIPTALSTPILGFYDQLAAEFLLAIGIGLMVVFAGWFYREAREEVGRGMDFAADIGFPALWQWHVRIFILAVIVIVIAIQAHGTYEFLGEFFGFIEPADG